MTLHSLHLAQAVALSTRLNGFIVTWFGFNAALLMLTSGAGIILFLRSRKPKSPNNRAKEQ